MNENFIKNKEDIYCKDCKFFNEDNVPADCEKGHGKVAFMRPACKDFVFEKTIQDDFCD